MKQVEKKHYYEMVYNTKERFCSYWHQINEILKCSPKNILEIGAGNNLVTDFLRKCEFKVTTLDIDPDLNPTVIGSVLDIPFKDNSFDIVICCQVLEHLKYEYFQIAIKQIQRVAKSVVIISLPDMKTVYRFYIEIPKFRINFFYPKPFSKPQKWKFNGEHYWNINNKGYPLKKIIIDLKASNLELTRHYRVNENPYHHFFILKKM